MHSKLLNFARIPINQILQLYTVSCNVWVMILRRLFGWGVVADIGIYNDFTLDDIVFLNLKLILFH